ncbi:hypothetical protein QYM41_05200 [Kocuria sp. CPCC 205268]|uniref:hypothetical protein n=1 Tax=Kocuria oxytropis TaxID=3058913 RepID=UPI0034D614ED
MSMPRGRTAGDQQWGRDLRLSPVEYNSYNSRASSGLGSASTVAQSTQVAGYIRPVSNFVLVSQHYGFNPIACKPHPSFENHQPLGHTDIDYAAAVGTDICSVDPGTGL